MSTPSVRDQFGKARDNTGFNTFSLKEDASAVIRLLPPMKSCIAEGRWGEYHKQHFGYAVRNPKDATKTSPRPFMCIEEVDPETKLTTVSCPECRKIEENEAALKDELSTAVEKFKQKGNKQDAAEKLAAEACKERADWLDAHRLDKKWYIPVMLEDGSFAIFRTPHAAYKAINKARKEMRDNEGGADVFDIDAGAFLKITRTGTGLSTDYTATIVKEARVLEDGKTRATVTKLAPLSDDQLTQALALPDVKTSTVLIRRLTANQIRMLVNGSGAPEEVETIMGLAQKADRSAAAPTPRPTPAPAPQQQAAPVEEEDADEKALREAQARIAAKAAAKASAASAPKAAPKAAPVALDDDIDDDEFASRFPPPKP